MKRWLQILLLFLVPALSSAEETWPAVLSRMPLERGTTQLNRTNCVQVMLRAFQSNGVIKALVFMPGATDEFYMFRRAQARLSTPAPTLMDAVSALTNQTRIRATFKTPFLVLHADPDSPAPKVTIRHAPTAEKLSKRRFLPHVEFNDKDWDSVQPLLKKHLGADVRPWRFSIDAYHFYRSALSGWDLSGLEALEAVALASRTRATVERRSFLGISGTLIQFEGEQPVEKSTR